MNKKILRIKNYYKQGLITKKEYYSLMNNIKNNIKKEDVIIYSPQKLISIFNI